MKQQRELILQLTIVAILGLSVWVFNTNAKIEVMNVKIETSNLAHDKDMASVKEDMGKNNRIIEKNTDALHKLEVVIGKLLERMKK